MYVLFYFDVRGRVTSRSKSQVLALHNISQYSIGMAKT